MVLYKPIQSLFHHIFNGFMQWSTNFGVFFFAPFVCFVTFHTFLLCLFLRTVWTMERRCYSVRSFIFAAWSQLHWFTVRKIGIWRFTSIVVSFERNLNCIRELFIYLSCCINVELTFSFSACVYGFSCYCCCCRLLYFFCFVSCFFFNLILFLFPMLIVYWTLVGIS